MRDTTTTHPNPVRARGADILAVGFGTAVAMWAAGYLSRVFTTRIPAWSVLAVLVLCLLTGGYVLGRFGRGAIGRAAGAGLITGLLNLLVLGSFLARGDQRDMLRSAAIWLPMSLLVCMGLTLLGAIAGRSRRSGPAPTSPSDLHEAFPWSFAFAVVAVAATFVLVIAGGLVTGFRAGLSVPDWPTSFHANMFLYPLARMTGGIYYEHTHRLYGALVGLTTLALALHLWFADGRRWLKAVLLLAVLAVIVQGTMGGLRVALARVSDSGITLNTPGDETMTSLVLAVVHGIFGQVFLGLMAAIAVFCSPTWRQAKVALRPTAAADRVLTAAALAALLVQLALGALQRQTHHVLLLHITGAAFTAVLVLTASTRAWGLYADVPLLPRLGLIGMGLLVIQLLLGVAAMVADGSGPPGAAVTAIVSTLHQAGGAALLVHGVLLHLWSARLVGPAPDA